MRTTDTCCSPHALAPARISHPTRVHNYNIYKPESFRKWQWLRRSWESTTLMQPKVPAITAPYPTHYFFTFPGHTPPPSGAGAHRTCLLGPFNTYINLNYTNFVPRSKHPTRSHQNESVNNAVQVNIRCFFVTSIQNTQIHSVDRRCGPR
jgi:hypothetical protein